MPRSEDEFSTRELVLFSEHFKKLKGVERPERKEKMINWEIYHAIRANGKRMEKIANATKLKRHWNKRNAMVEKAEAFVVAECQRQHVKLCEEDVLNTAWKLYREAGGF